MDRRGLVAAVAGFSIFVLAACEDNDDGGDRPVPLVQANVASMDAIGDSISKGFNAVDDGELCQAEQESRNFSTGDTHGDALCSDGGEGIFSQAERLECVQGKQIVRADPNTALSGARMLTEFADQARAAAAFLAAQPEPRFVTILLGHNDVCSGTVDRVQTSCPNGADEDPQNHCRTTPPAFERELREGMDALIAVPSLRIGVAAPARVSLICEHGSRDLCIPAVNCDDFWEAAVETQIPDERGVCGSLTADCSDERIASAYVIEKSYRDVLAAVAAEYQGSGTKAAGVEVVFSDAAWRGKFEDGDLSCCDCFHPSDNGQDRLARVLFEGYACGDNDVCCADTGDPVQDGKCAVEDRSGAFQPGFFPPI